MRCRNCNVDLPENYVFCPLCREKAYPDAPLIEGIKTAEYPKVNTEPYNCNPFPFFIAIWIATALLSFMLFKLNILSSLYSALLAAFPACIWTLLIRPFKVKQLYAGNYIMMNLFPFSLACLLADNAVNGSYEKAFMYYIPTCCLVVFAALFILILARPKECKRAASYPVLMFPVCIGAIIVLWLFYGKYSFVWCIVLAICLFILAYLFIARKKETREELEAKFSLQKPVK